MISYADLNVPISQALDDETSQRYLTSNRINAINWALNRAQSAFGWALANRKGSEEAMRDFTKIGIWQTDPFGAAVIDDPLLGYTVANVLGVYVDPDLESPVDILPLSTSQYRSDASWANAGKQVRRVTLEQVPVIKNNGSMQGNEVFATNDGRRTYAYYLNNGKVYVLPRSYMGQKLIAIAHIEKFPLMVDETSTTTLPPYLTNIIADWACEFLAVKQGAGGETLGSFSSRDASTLFGFAVN